MHEGDCHSFRASSLVLYPWDVGTAVAELQELLCAHGFHKLRVDGDFGSKTEVAVKLYQKRCGLRIDGIVGAETWASLKSSVRPGSRVLQLGKTGADVLELQGLLQVYGYNLRRDGDFGEKTQAAVMSFQAQHQLHPDGIVTLVIWTLLQGRKIPFSPSSSQKRRSGWTFF